MRWQISLGFFTSPIILGILRKNEIALLFLLNVREKNILHLNEQEKEQHKLNLQFTKCNQTKIIDIAFKIMLTFYLLLYYHSSIDNIPLHKLENSKLCIRLIIEISQLLFINDYWCPTFVTRSNFDQSVSAITSNQCDVYIQNKYLVNNHIQCFNKAS